MKKTSEKDQFFHNVALSRNGIELPNSAPIYRHIESEYQELRTKGALAESVLLVNLLRGRTTVGTVSDVIQSVRKLGHPTIAECLSRPLPPDHLYLMIAQRDTGAPLGYANHGVIDGCQTSVAVYPALPEEDYPTFPTTEPEEYPAYVVALFSDKPNGGHQVKFVAGPSERPDNLTFPECLKVYRAAWAEGSYAAVYGITDNGVARVQGDPTLDRALDLSAFHESIGPVGLTLKRLLMVEDG